MANEKLFGNIDKNNLTLEKVNSLVSGPKYTMSREVYEQLLLSALQINSIQDYFNQYLLPTTGSTTENEFTTKEYVEDNYTKQTGTYPNLTVGKADKLTSFIVKGRQTTNIGWHKAMEIKAANIGAIGGTGYSALVLVNGVRGSTGESVTPAGSSIVEVDCRVDGATKTFFPTFLKINILNGWLNTRNICAVLSTDNTTISVYINIEERYMQYNFTKLTEGAEGVENVNALTFIDEYYGTSALSGAIYGEILNNATYATKADELTDPFVIGSDTNTAQTWITKFATMTLKVPWVSSTARFDIVDNNYANIATTPVGVEISASPTATDLNLHAYILYGNPKILERMYISYSAVGTFPMTVDLYYVSGSTGYSSLGIKPLWQIHRNTASSLEFITTNTNVSTLPTDKTNIRITSLTNYGPITRAYSATRDGADNVITDTYATKAEISNPNLIINPDFSINQRGQTSYIGNGYTVDRWKGGQSQAKVSVVNEGITLSFSEAMSSGAIALSQIVDMNASKIIGERVSISTKITAVTGNYWYIRLRCTDSSNNYIGELSATISKTGIVSATGTIPANTATIAFQFCVKPGNVPTTDSLTVEWAKLEEGSVATAFTKPLIAEELPKCQRYYLKIQASSTYSKFGYGDITSTSSGDIQINIPQTMRTTPTITISSGLNLYERPTAVYSKVTSVTVRSITAAAVIIRLTTSGTAFTTNNLCFLQSSSTDDNIQIDAEIY